MQSFQRAIHRKIVVLLAPLGCTLDAPERAPHRIDLNAFIVETILHLHVDCPAQRIETESGIVGHYRDQPYRGGRNQIPVDHVAERLVDTYSVLVNGKALRRARYRRCHEAAKLHVWLEWVARDLIDDDARDVSLQSVGNIRRPHALNLICVNEIDACRNLINVDARTRYGSGRVHYKGWRWPNGARRITGPAGFCAWRRPGDHDRRQGLHVAGCALGLSRFISNKEASQYRNNNYEANAHRSSSHRAGCSGLSRLDVDVIM